MGSLCPDCQELQVYTDTRLAKCPYQEGKTTCVKCPTHCYNKHMKNKVQEVMRYAGPRMLHRHPVLALFHLFDGLKKTPSKPNKREII
jgi:hypothetical protein